MLDIKTIRQNPKMVADTLKKKGYDFDIVGFNSLDARRKQAEVETQSLQAERNATSKQIGELIRDGMAVDEAKQSVNETLAKISEQLDGLYSLSKDLQRELSDLLLRIPNLPDEDVPGGSTEDDNIEIGVWGTPRQFDFEAVDHVDVGEGLGGLDFAAASKLTGSRFVVMHGMLARLNRALTQFMLDTHTTEHGYSEVYVPYIVNSDSLYGTGQLPKFEEDLFKLEHEQSFYLIPTAEVPVTNLVRDTIVEDAEMEKGLRYACHTPCFRSEAGSYGRDTRGMIRQHQFEKIELVQMVRPAESAVALEELTGHAEAILQKLNLPYRKVILCGGDLSFSAHKTYDLEVWLPGQSAYREISSCSGFGDYQARRMKARWRNPETGRPEYLHTLNGSGLAVGRALVAVLENYQNEDGSVTIPDVLQPYMGGLTLITV
jgi:seryl-tRNA synthetase